MRSLLILRVLRVLLVLSGGCTCPHGARPPDGAQPERARLITVTSSRLGPQPVVVVLPRRYDPGRAARYPLLIAFSGRGEAVLAPERGAWGWERDYELTRQMAALERGKLEVGDFHGLVTPARLHRYNRSLSKDPFKGMVVACPHTFDLLGSGSPRHAAYERFYLEELPRALRRRYHVRRDPRGLGIDGVSLGGLWSLVLGLAHPGRVGQIGALQPAVTDWIDELAALAARNRGALRRRPLSLVTSSGDGLRPAVTRLSARLLHAGVRHTLTVLTGPHDYVFNRGPGGLHMLLWHDRSFNGVGPAIDPNEGDRARRRGGER
jgi:hypothetical protein